MPGSTCASEQSPLNLRRSAHHPSNRALKKRVAEIFEPCRALTTSRTECLRVSMTYCRANPFCGDQGAILESMVEA